MSNSRASTTITTLLLLSTLYQTTVNAVEVDVVDRTGRIDPLDTLKIDGPIEIENSCANTLHNYFVTWLRNPKNTAGVDLNSKELSIDMLFHRAWPASEYMKEIPGAVYRDVQFDEVDKERKQLAEGPNPRELVSMASLSLEEREYYYFYITFTQKIIKENSKTDKVPSWFYEPIHVKEIFRNAFNYCAHAKISIACKDAADLVNIAPPKGEENNWISSIDGSKERAQKTKALLLSQKSLLESSLFADAEKQAKAGQRQEIQHKAWRLEISKHVMKFGGKR